MPKLTLVCSSSNEKLSDYIASLISLTPKGLVMTLSFYETDSYDSLREKLAQLTSLRSKVIVLDRLELCPSDFLTCLAIAVPNVLEYNVVHITTNGEFSKVLPYFSHIEYDLVTI